jgi:hypothetical protein
MKAGLMGRENMWAKLIIVGALLPALVGCAGGAGNFSMYPNAVDEGQSVDADMAVLLVGNAGPSSVNYLQFEHSSLPAINARGIDLPPNGIVAIPVPVGLTGVSLEDYTVSGRGAGYLPSGIAVGYIPVHSPKINISIRGLYYVATIRPGSPEGYSIHPDPGALIRLRRANPALTNLKPINFSWLQ